MSSTYVTPAGVASRGRRSRGLTGFLGLGAALAGVTAVGAAVAISLIPVQAPASAPALTRPAIDDSRSYIGSEDTHRLFLAPETSMGFWDYIDTRPAVPATGARESYKGYADARPSVAARPAMPASLGHGDFTLARSVAADVVPFDEQRTVGLGRRDSR
jgi:hypothetical protein